MTQKTLDKIGMALSIGCMIHCFAMPIILPILPLIGLVFKHEGMFHIYIGTAIVLVAAFAIDRGRHVHNKWLPCILVGIGIPLIMLGGGMELRGIEGIKSTLITIIGSLCIASAHYINHRYLCSCNHHNH